MVASRTASHRKKLNSHADSTKLVKPSNRIARLSQSLRLMSFIGTLSQTLTLRAAFASSTYLLSQIPRPGRHLMMPCCSFWTMAGQPHCQRRIAKHLSRAGLCHCRRNYVTRFLQKDLVSICVIAFDVNFIEDRKSVAICDF